jgi:hypothetical protein
VKCVYPQRKVNEQGVETGYPCGQCMPCRITRRQEWTFRILCEMKMSHNHYFVTLTYNPENLPEGGNLVKEHVQLFLKKLRHRHNGKIRYFAVGEYGEKRARPHYHLIIFTDSEFNISPNKAGRFQCLEVDESWSRGFADVCLIPSLGDGLTIARYCATYTLKKLTTEERMKDPEFCGRNYPELMNRTPEFSLMSRMPGIGLAYAQRYAKQITKLNIDPRGLHMARMHGKLWPMGRVFHEHLCESVGVYQCLNPKRVKTLKENNTKWVEVEKKCGECDECKNRKWKSANKVLLERLHDLSDPRSVWEKEQENLELLSRAKKRARRAVQSGSLNG